jgi:hypothetical protein
MFNGFNIVGFLVCLAAPRPIGTRGGTGWVFFTDS